VAAIEGQSITGEIVACPAVLRSDSGAVSLSFKRRELT
jgi:hypothetical protein